MGNLEIGLLFTNIPLDKAINICANIIHSQQDIRYQQRRFLKSFIISYKRNLFYFQRGLI